VVVRGGPLWTDALLLRDFLRATPEAAARYAGVKRAALAAGANTLLRYSSEKAPLIAELLAAARKSGDTIDNSR
jgi:GrpB-like predicted nucleotidyltransferase (UPF0157 family)